MRKLFLLATAITAVVSAAPAAAVLFAGKTVQATYYFPSIVNVYSGPSDYTVGTSAPFNPFGINSIAVSDTQITLTAFCGRECVWTETSFNGFGLSDFYGTVNAFTGVTINAATSYVGFDASRITFDANNVYVNWQGLNANGTIVLDVASGAVPEPASWAMLIAGFGLVGAAARRRRVIAA